MPLNFRDFTNCKALARLFRTFRAIRDINRAKSSKVQQIKFERNNRKSNSIVISYGALTIDFCHLGVFGRNVQSTAFQLY